MPSRTIIDIGASPDTTAAATLELWRLSRYAIDNRQLRALIESCESWQIPAVLNATSAGRELLAGIDAYDRCRTRDGVPPASSWLDDPTPVIESLRELMRRPDDDAPAAPLRLAA